MKKKKLQCSVPTLLLTGVLCLTLAACGAKQSSLTCLHRIQTPAVSAALPVKAMNAKTLTKTPIWQKSDANIHHDGYNTDSTDEVLPLGICPRSMFPGETNANAFACHLLLTATATQSFRCSAALAIPRSERRGNHDAGLFLPKAGMTTAVTSSRALYVPGLGNKNRLPHQQQPCADAAGKPMEEQETSCPEFEKVLDVVGIKAAAEAALGKELTQNLLSVVFDYDGNLWFATGGFRIYPEREQQGVLGYRPLGDRGDPERRADRPFEGCLRLRLWRSARRGKRDCRLKDGAVILTNQNCYLCCVPINGVEAVWCTPAESVGAKGHGRKRQDHRRRSCPGQRLLVADAGSCDAPPTTRIQPVKLLALDMKTGEIVASLPVLDDLPEGYQVAVENSAIVYDDSEGTVSTIVCNWFGAGSAGLADPDSDSSIQSYANIYDTNWLTKGNCMIAPGVERVDAVKTDSGYKMKSVWSRNDLSDTSIMKLSTATGYIYGYVQDLESGMWQYIILDFATGETVFTMDVSNKYGYNNMDIGMYAENSGNALYCPTGYLELLCLQDRFVYLPEMPYRKVDLDKSARNMLSQAQFEQDGGKGAVASWRNTVTVENVHPNTTVSFRMNNLSGSTAKLKPLCLPDGTLAEVSKRTGQSRMKQAAPWIRFLTAHCMSCV